MGTFKLTTVMLLTWISLSIGLTAAQTTVAIIEPVTKLQLISGIPSAHNKLVCSTWGNFHFLTFDGDSFQLPSECNHILTSQCGGSYEEFNIQLRRQIVNGEPTISKITLKLDGTVVELSTGSISINGQPVTAPYVSGGVHIELVSSYISIKSTVGITALWNEDDAFMVELDPKYKNQTCGLCGDFNGVPRYDEMIKNGVALSPSDYGNLWKMDGPTERCEDKPIQEYQDCGGEDFCPQLFTSEAFGSCNLLVSNDMFVTACMEDLCQCNTTTDASCLCKTLAEYSRQCVHAGGKPQEWRTDVFCPKSCPNTMQYTECGSPCIDTCSNSDRGDVCGEHCIDGCFCPPGTVWDDVTNSSCIPRSSCSCVHGDKIYKSGETYTATCKECTCSGGQWTCVNKDCPGTCSVLGGSHIKTFDDKPYTFHGDCSYILAKECTGTDFTILGDLTKCGLTDTETCLKTVTLGLSKGTKVIQVDSSGKVEVDRIKTQLPIFTADVSIFQPSSFYITISAISSNLILEIQLVPLMQVFIMIDPAFQRQTCGLCGNFNNIQADDFTTASGLREGTAVDFANTYKTRANCPDIQRTFENPCSLSTENEKYAQHWCSLLSDPSGVFSPCHSQISPDIYKASCIYDTCNCEKSENCMCAALSSYAHDCAAVGIILTGWRDAACNNYTVCPNSLVYEYDMTSCHRTCRLIGQTDYTCDIETVTDGCGCQSGTYMNENNVCVTENNCPCYDANTIIQPGDIISKDGTTCTCRQGKLNCIGVMKVEECTTPMTFFNCSSAAPGSTGSECQKSCKTLDMSCISTECVSGCVCPPGLVSNGNGGCISTDLCPCVHNGENYQPGDTVQDGCNTCTCKDRKWQCTTKQCSATCSIYGDGHYITFDEKRYMFSGNCEYALAQDYCSGSSTNGTFRVNTENIPCGTTGTTCSKAIKLFIGSNELILTDGTYQVVQRTNGEEIPYQIRTMGNYLVVETYNGVMLVWDRKTSIYIVLKPEFNGNVCGLCGNFDGNANNDFTTRTQEVVIDPLIFGNSWKVSPTCPEAMAIQDPCTNNPYREAWAQKQCSIINSDTFAACHSKVEPSSYYSSCVSDACACDSGGDCECFCTAVAAYAKACNAAGVCVQWRSPRICPLFCDFYNPPGECEWHYKPCGHNCMKTCRNPTGNCTMQSPGLEGCYPECPADLPLFDEDNMKCVAQDECGCYAEMMRYELGQSIPSINNCEKCECTSGGKSCKYDLNACTCQNNNTMYQYGDIIYYTTDGLGNCIIAICAEDGNINKTLAPCKTTVAPTVPTTTFTTTTMPTTVFVFTTPEISPSATTKEAATTTPTSMITEGRTTQITVTTSITEISAITKIPSTLTGTTPPTTLQPEITSTQPLETTTGAESTIYPEITTFPITTLPTTTTKAPEITSTGVEVTTVLPIVSTTQATTAPSIETTLPGETTPLTTTTAPTITTMQPEISSTQPLETTTGEETTISPEKTTLPITTLPTTTTKAPEITSTGVEVTTVLPIVSTTQATTAPSIETTGPSERTSLITTPAPEVTTLPSEISSTQPLETTTGKETTISPEQTTLPITTLPTTTTKAPEVTSTGPSTETTPVGEVTTVLPIVSTTQATTAPSIETTLPGETTPLTTAPAPKITTLQPEISSTQPLETTTGKETTISPEQTTLPITTLPTTTTKAPEVTSTGPSTETTPVGEVTTVLPIVSTTQATTAPP
ncbi:mucin-5AC [Silurus meridionalis]|uniref:mucin-5AC n=1 Tax=Silurus meridionalis TaxID=175797 RepID=UPI001EECC880|nr:mucin-5AC [Silurus meridionalis]